MRSSEEMLNFKHTAPWSTLKTSPESCRCPVPFNYLKNPPTQRLLQVGRPRCLQLALLFGEEQPESGRIKSQIKTVSLRAHTPSSTQGLE